MDVTEKWGTDVDVATELALEELGLTIDEVNVTVLKEASKGFFGIGAKLALVRVEKKSEEEMSQKADEIEESSEKNLEIKESSAEDVFTDDKSDVESIGTEFIKELTEKMGLDLVVTGSQDKDYVHIDIKGKEAGTIIGKRGQTLDAIQYLTSLVVNKGQDEYVRIIVDAENYREKREEALVKLAHNLANKAKKTKKRVKLEPMNPYERKIIHSTLQGDKFVKTRSEGEDPYRRVIIEPK